MIPIIEPKKVLIVGIDCTTRSSLSAFIKEKCPDWIIIEAEDGYQAMDITNQENIDFFTVDDYLPGLSGLNLIIELKRVHTPGKFVLFTSPLSEHLKTEIETIAVKHLDKPVTEKTMNSMLRYFEP